MVNVVVGLMILLGNGGDEPMFVPFVANVALGVIGLLATAALYGKWHAGHVAMHVSACFTLPGTAIFVQFLLAIARYLAEGGC